MFEVDAGTLVVVDLTPKRTVIASRMTTNGRERPVSETDEILISIFVT